MRKHFAVTLLSFLIGTVTVFYFGCASPQNSNSNTNAVATPSAEPTPDKAAIEAELTRIENDWPRILKERDSAAVRKVEADDILLVYPDGSAGSKDQDIKDVEAGALSADSWELSDLTVSVIDNDSAVVRLRTTVKGGKYKEPNGKTQDVSGDFRSVDTFARLNGQWQLVASATVPVRNPAAASTPSPSPKPSVSPKSSPSPKPSVSPKSSPAARPTPARLGTPQRKPSPQ